MAYDNYVRVAVDGAGKYIRNQSLYLPIDLLDGAGPTPTLVQQQVTLAGDPLSGKLVETDLAPLLQELIELQREIKEGFAHLLSGEQVSDEVATEPRRLWAGVQFPPRAEGWQFVRQLGDRLGRTVVAPHAPREAVGTQGTTLSNTTAETTIISAGQGFNDPLLLVVSNTSTSTSSRIDFRDTTAGTVLFSLQSVGGGPPCGFCPGIALPQTTPNQNWTAQCATAVTDVRIYAVYIKAR